MTNNGTYLIRIHLIKLGTQNSAAYQTYYRSQVFQTGEIVQESHCRIDRVEHWVNFSLPETGI